MDNDIFKRFDMNPKVKYFISYYFDKVEMFRQGLPDFSIFNLHTLINLVVEELSKNNNNRNLTFFYNKLQEIKKKDIVLKNDFDYKTNEIINNLTSNKEYALVVANSLLLDVENGIYGKKIFDRLLKLLYDNNDLEKNINEIQYLTEAILNELIIYGYDEKSLDIILYNIFSGYYQSESYISTDFPVPEGVAEGDIKEYIDNLTIENRLNAFKKYFDKKSKKYYCLFNLSGIQGKNLNVHLNNVDIYNWQTNPRFDIELNEEKMKMIPQYKYGNFKNNEIHCSVCIETIDKNSLFKNVIQQVDSALDILYTHHNFNCKILVDYSEYIVFDENENVVLEGITREYDEDFQRKVRPLDYNSEDDIQELNAEYNNYSKFVLNNKDISHEIIKNSVRYYRKGKEAKRIEEKILNYWICIENLLKIGIKLPNSIVYKNFDDMKLNLIVSLLPYINFQVSITSELWRVHDYYYNKYLQEPTNLKKENAEALQFKTGRIYLANFVNNFELLENMLSSEFDLKNYQRYINILTDKTCLEKYINNYIANTKDTLLLCYRSRNMIVHNAQYDITYMDFYAKQLNVICIRLLNVITNEIYNNELKKDLEKILIWKCVEQRQLIKDFEKISLREWVKTNN